MATFVAWRSWSTIPEFTIMGGISTMKIWMVYDSALLTLEICEALECPKMMGFAQVVAIEKWDDDSPVDLGYTAWTSFVDPVGHID